MDKKEQTPKGSLRDNKVTKRTLVGQVVSVAMDKTIIVLVVSRKLHPKYKKQYKTSKKYHVHDELEVAKLDDKVSFVECRPLSKTKRWSRY